MSSLPRQPADKIFPLIPTEVIPNFTSPAYLLPPEHWFVLMVPMVKSPNAPLMLFPCSLPMLEETLLPLPITGTSPLHWPILQPTQTLW